MRNSATIGTSGRPRTGMDAEFSLTGMQCSRCEPPGPPDYPFHDRAIQVTSCGRICIGRRKINLSDGCGGQTVGVREVEDQIWLVSFLDYDLGYFDNERGRVEPGLNPFAPDKVLTMYSEQGVNHVTGIHPCSKWRARRD